MTVSVNRVSAAFDAARADGRAALVVYLTAGDPSIEQTADIVEAAYDAGADVVELGVPFSDPNADGPVIQAAMLRALAQGGGLHASLACVRALRARGCEVPIVLFGYYNPICAAGVEGFCREAKDAGIDAVLTVDLPINELDELYRPLAQHGMGVIPLVAPTSGADRIAAAGRFRPPFVYYVSMTGVTGASFGRAEVDRTRVEGIQSACDAPVAVGFGIKTPEDVARTAKLADGVVVGSAIVQKIIDAQPGCAASDVRDFVASLRAATAKTG